MTDYITKLNRRYGKKVMNKMFIRTGYSPKYSEFEDIYWRLMANLPMPGSQFDSICGCRKQLEREWAIFEDRITKYLVAAKL